jgi:DNA-binding winged helix-turn-helix (wHTH) protein
MTARILTLDVRRTLTPDEARPTPVRRIEIAAEPCARYFPLTRRLWRDGEMTQLDRNEGALLHALLHAGEKGVGFDALARSLWPRVGRDHANNSRRQCLHRLRSCLSDAGIPLTIEVVPGAAYVCTGRVEIVDG